MIEMIGCDSLHNKALSAPIVENWPMGGRVDWLPTKLIYPPIYTKFQKEVPMNMYCHEQKCVTDTYRNNYDLIDWSSDIRTLDVQEEGSRRKVADSDDKHETGM